MITDGDTVVAESGAIIEYLVEKHGGGRLKPAVDDPNWLNYQYWLHYAEGSLMPLMVMTLLFRRVPGAPDAVLRHADRQDHQRRHGGRLRAAAH